MKYRELSETLKSCHERGILMVEIVIRVDGKVVEECDWDVGDLLNSRTLMNSVCRSVNDVEGATIEVIEKMSLSKNWSRSHG
jgi:hypothetical protein